MPENVADFQSRPRRGRPEPEAIDLDVIYEDEAFIVVNKAAGMVVHPTYKNWSGTLLNGLLWRLRDRDRGPDGPILPGIVTRLDKETSGLVIAAFGPVMHARMQKDGGSGRVTKEYLAFVRGVPAPPAGTISLPLARSTEDRRRVVVTPSGQASETRYEVLSTVQGGPEGRPLLSLVRCELVTGRTHQIRVHLAASGWPIVGDPVYGEPDPAIARQALHAWRVRMPHPVTRVMMRFEASPPAELDALVKIS
jgi:23S rRNA pseudouridine1911/1915/1917 synthase